MVSKIIRKLGLGPAALKLIKPFIVAGAALPDVEQALALLQAHNPDKGSSCIITRGRRTGSAFMLDILIPAYNAEKHIERCLDSVLGQTAQYSFRAIVVNDGSKDGTASILERYSADERVLIKHQENKGLSGARNAGLELSDAPYIMFLDADDFLPEGSIEALMSAALENDAHITEGGFTRCDLSGNTLSEDTHKSGQLDLRCDMYGFACMKVFRAELFDSVSFPEGYLYEDSIMSQIVYPLCEKQGCTAWGVSKSVYNYSVNPDGITGSSPSRPKSTDSLWITLQLFKDRQKLGLKNDQGYYEYLLRMLVLSYRRAERQGEEIKKAMFILWKDFFEKEFSGFATKDKKYETLQQALRRGNYPLYSASCRLI